MDKELCILVIEDEEAIRTILKDELELQPKRFFSRFYIKTGVFAFRERCASN